MAVFVATFAGHTGAAGAQPIDLGTLGGAHSYAYAVNATGQVVGEAATSGYYSHAFSWTAAGGMVDLGTLGGPNSSAVDIDGGWAVGYSNVPDWSVHAVLWVFGLDEDEDDDGVSDADDVCLGTAPGDVVDTGGCSIAQLCPCAGPMNTTAPWYNHGQYVSCVAGATNDFAVAGLIAPNEKGAINSTAAKSSCGSKQ